MMMELCMWLSHCASDNKPNPPLCTSSEAKHTCQSTLNYTQVCCLVFPPLHWWSLCDLPKHTPLMQLLGNLCSVSANLSLAL